MYGFICWIFEYELPPPPCFPFFLQKLSLFAQNNETIFRVLFAEFSGKKNQKETWVFMSNFLFFSDNKKKIFTEVVFVSEERHKNVLGFTFGIFVYKILKKGKIFLNFPPHHFSTPVFFLHFLKWFTSNTFTIPT